MPRILPPPGWNVYWYSDGQKNQQPQAAIVTSASNNGVLTLTGFPDGGGTIHHRGVRHVDDEDLKSRPAMARRTGGWDFIPGFMPMPESDYLLPKKCRDFFADGFNPGDIAKKLEVRQGLVSKILDKEIEAKKIADKKAAEADPSKKQKAAVTA